MKTRLLGAVCACIIIQMLSVPAISAPVFPGEIRACVTSTVCTNPTLIQREPTFSAYSYLDGGILKALFEYNLWPSSNESTNFVTTQLSGAAWVSANQTYDLTQERHFFTLYLDGVTPMPTNLWVFDSDGLDVELSMPTPDLFAGSSFFWDELAFDGSTFGEGDLVTHGDQAPRLPGFGLVVCLDETCRVGAELNLLYMQYVQSGSLAELNLNPTDPRGLLYRQYQDYDRDDTYYLSQSYQVVPIPIPPAAWLFGSGLLGLVGIAGKKEAKRFRGYQNFRCWPRVVV